MSYLGSMRMSKVDRLAEVSHDQFQSIRKQRLEGMHMSFYQRMKAGMKQNASAVFTDIVWQRRKRFPTGSARKV